MDGSVAVSRLSWRNPVLVGILVVLLVAGATVLWQVVRAGAVGAPSLLDQSVRFRIVGQAVATPDPTVFTRTSFVVPNNRAVDITDVVLQNPHGDAGMMRIQIGEEVILEENLSGLRDQHFDIPLHVRGGQAVIVAVNCAVPGPPQPVTGRCAPSASFFG